MGCHPERSGPRFARPTSRRTCIFAPRLVSGLGFSQAAKRPQFLEKSSPRRRRDETLVANLRDTAPGLFTTSYSLFPVSLQSGGGKVLGGGDGGVLGVGSAFSVSDHGPFAEDSLIPAHRDPKTLQCPFIVVPVCRRDSSYPVQHRAAKEHYLGSSSHWAAQTRFRPLFFAA